MMKLKQSLKNSIYPVLLISLSLYGCSHPSPSPKTTIEEELINSFNKTTKLDYPLYTNTRIAGKTFWIYIATEKDILTISSKKTKAATPNKIIKFLDIKSTYQGPAFNFNYIFLKYNPEEKATERDILKESAGGGTLYQDFTDTTIEILQKTYFAIGDIIHKAEEINFFIICLANIKEGMKVTFIIHKLDIEQFLLNMLPSDEFYNRILLKTDGGRQIVNDKYGAHIKYHDILLVDFLREQIVNNANSKIRDMEEYYPKQLEALEKIDNIILKNAYEVTIKYEFQDFLFIEIEDTITKNKLIISKSKLLNRFNESSPSYSPEESSY